MIYPTANIIRQLMLETSLGGTDWPVFVGYLPDLPDNAICVYDTAGRLDGRIMRTGEQIEHAGIQTRVRGLNYLAVQAKALAIADMFDVQFNSEVEMESDDAFVLSL